MLNAVGASVPPAQQQTAAADLYNRASALSVDSTAAAELKAFLQLPAVTQALQALAASLPASDPAATGITTLLTAAQRPDLTPAFKAQAGDPFFQQELTRAIAVIAPDKVAPLKEI